MSTLKCLEEGRTGLVVPIVDFNRCEGTHELKTSVRPYFGTVSSQVESDYHLLCRAS